jgi:transposase
MSVMSGTSTPPLSAEQLAALPPEFRELLQSVIEHYERRCDALLREVAELKAELRSVRKTPRNSSLPPSTEHPHAKTSGTGESDTGEAAATTKKRRGGQKGHPKHERLLVPVEQCDEVVSCRPAACRGCGTNLRKADDDPEPLRHQVWEVPQPEPIITEYQRHRVSCPCCGVRTCGELPDGVPEHTSGPRLMAVTGVLMGLFRQSKSRTSLALLTLFGVPCCPATRSTFRWSTFRWSTSRSGSPTR